MKKSQYRTSYSALQTFKQCPQKYKFQAIDRISAPRSKEAIFGNVIHMALKFFHSKYPVSPTSDELLNYYKDIWNPEPFQSQEEDMIYFSEGIRMLKNYYQYFLKNRDTFTVLDIESRFEIPIENPETKQTCTLAGKIDRIDKLKNETIEIVDYKTAKRLPPQTEVDNNLQFSIYCLAVFLRWPHLKIKRSENIKLSFHYLRHGEILSTKRTKNQLDETKNEIWKIISKIEKGNFKPLPSVLCDWCGYKSICPMWKHKFSKRETIDDKRIQKIIEEFLKMKEQNQINNKEIAKFKKIIDDYLDQKNIERVFGESGYITRIAQIRYKYEMNKIKEILEPLGRWQDILAVDNAKLKNIIKTLPHPLRKQIEKAKKVDKEYTILKTNIKKERS